jgi:hypothetical protein
LAAPYKFGHQRQRRIDMAMCGHIKKDRFGHRSYTRLRPVDQPLLPGSTVQQAGGSVNAPP